MLVNIFKLTNYDVWKYISLRREVVVQKMVLFLRSCCSLKGWNKRWKTQGNPSFKWKFVWEKSKSLWAATFLLELLEGSCQEKQDHGNSGRNCGHIIGCASLLNGPICITHCHRRKGSDLSRLSTLIRSHSSQQRSSVGDSSLYDDTTMIFNAQARHFNLLLPQGSSSNALLYYQATKNARRRLNTRTKN